MQQVPVNPWLSDVAARIWVRGEAEEMYAGDFRGRDMCVLNYRYSTAGSMHPVHLVALSMPVALPPLTVSKDYAAAVLQPPLVEWMRFNPGLEWEFAGNALVSWGEGRFEVPELMGRLEAMAGVIDRIPPAVLREYGA